MTNVKTGAALAPGFSSGSGSKRPKTCGSFRLRLLSPAYVYVYFYLMLRESAKLALGEDSAIVKDGLNVTIQVCEGDLCFGKKNN